MERVMTKDAGRLKKGQRYDYPTVTWNGIAKALKQKLDAFSKPVDAVLGGAK